MTLNLTRIGIILLIWTLASCKNSTPENIESKEEQVVDEFDKYMLEIKNNQKTLPKAMSEKGIKLVINGPCDDALGDTLHARSKVYIDSVEIKENIIASFKFKEACCQDYLADYELVGDTMIVSLGLVSEEVCECICWYNYRFETKSKNVKHIRFNEAP